MREVLCDIETSPEISANFGRKNVFIGNANVIEPPRMLCFAAKVVGEGRTEFWSEWGPGGRKRMARELFRTIDEADVLIHYNGTTFDEPWANTTMKLAGGYKAPPSPVKRVDLYQQSKKFYLPSHKLEYVATRLVPTEGKLSNAGIELWLRVLGYRGKEAQRVAREDMRAYNVQDVEIMEPVYLDLRPWMTGLPNAALHDSDVTERDENGRIVYLPPACRCGSTNLQKRGFHKTQQSKFQRYQCRDCGSWAKDSRAIARIQMTEAR
jgi:hypothetical protein